MTREEKIALARELRESGLTYQKIGERLGVGRETVRRWLNPEAAEKVREYFRSDKRREWQRENYSKRRDTKLTLQRERQRRRAKASEHPEVTYCLGSPGVSRVIVGKTKNWQQRASAYNKSLVPLRVLAMTRIPEGVIHKRFEHLQSPGYSAEVFELTPELQGFIDSCWPIFRQSECFTGEQP